MTNETKLFSLADQIDGENYEDFGILYYDNIVYYAQQSEVWTANDNPWNTADNEVYIKNELRVPAGVTITLDNFKIYFAPEAKLIIENGSTSNGGKLVLTNGSLLSSDERCYKDLWLGVQVWGNQNQSQGTMANSTQGRLEIIGNSGIENAHFGALASKIVDVTRNSQGLITGYQFDDSRNGGIIQANRGEFKNNRTGVYLRKYLPLLNTAANQSQFKLTDFSWSSLLIRPDLSINAHIEISEVRGIRILGCTFGNYDYLAFENQFNSVYSGGVGVLSRASSFYVLQDPSTFAVNRFNNMQAGIFAQGNQIQSFSSNKSIFKNNIIGILSISTKFAKITANTFAVRENTYQTAGLGLFYSTKYTVEDNDFFEEDIVNIAYGNGNSYGIVVNNSGIDNNEIYRNRFKNLKVGGQTEGNNAISLVNNDPNSGEPFTMSGLRWTCNVFSERIYKADLTLAKGSRMHYNQGIATGGGSSPTYDTRVKGAARNTFSMVGETFSAIQHDLMAPNSAQSFSYAHLYDLNHTPDSYSPIVNIDGVELNSQPVYMTQNGCPARKLIFSGIELLQLKSSQDSITEIIGKITEKLELGSNDVLLNRINTVTNISSIKNELLAASPNLSDEILLAYLDRNPSAGHIKEVMIANSGLSSQVRTKLNTMSLPNGIRNQINQTQNKLSGRTLNVWERNYLIALRDIIFNWVTNIERKISKT